MILIEFIKFFRAGFIVRKQRFINELKDINNIQIQYIKSFTFKKYWNNNINFKDNKVFTFLIIISLGFIFIMVYHSICFIFYTIDLYITFFLKFFFNTLVFILDQWETSIYQKINIYRRDPILSNKYTKEQAVSAQAKVKFFTVWTDKLTEDLNKCLQFEKRNYSVFIKFLKYSYVCFNSFYKWFISCVKFYVPIWWIQFNEWLWDNTVWYGYRTVQYIFYVFLFIAYLFVKFILFIYITYLRVKAYVLFKFKLYKTFYMMKRNANIEIYNYLYSAYYKYYRRFKLVESFFYKELFSDEMIDDVIINSFIFKFVNFKFLYFWHCHIKPIPYFIFLEKTYDFNCKKKDSIKTLILIRGMRMRPFFMRNWIFLLSKISKICIFISPYYEKYYAILSFYIRKYTKIFLYHMLVIIRFFIVLPRFLVVYPYVPLKESISFIIKFLKVFFNK